MIKKVKVKDLKPGMYIHNFGCGWLKHPFLTRQKMLKNWWEIEKIEKYGIKEVYIDTFKGLDFVKRIDFGEFKKAFKDKDSGAAILDEKPVIIREALDKELQTAVKIKDETRMLIDNITRDVKLGKQINIAKSEDVVNQILGSITRNKDALFTLISFKNSDEYTYNHSVNVAVLMTAFCKAIGMTEQQTRSFGVGALLHDIGKAKIPEHILNKPKALSEEEFMQMKKHPVYGRDILSAIQGGISDNVIKIALEHHEQLDGNGYPGGLKGHEISYGGRITAIIDSYDALTSDRVYHHAIDPTSALKIIYERSQEAFDFDLFLQFIQAIGIYPVGSLVRLNGGFLAIVVESGRDNPLRPIVRLIYDINKKRPLTPRNLDLSQGVGELHGIVSSESAKKWNIDTADFISVPSVS